MAPPDLNTLPESPRNTPPPPTNYSTTNSRRTSQMTGTPLLPTVTSSGFSQHNDEGDVPLRHPRPLTTAELHLEMEKEQEAAVNRLARELSQLRAQHSASVASTASSTTSALDPQHQHAHPTGTTSPIRHRSSSSLSTRSHTNAQAHHSGPSQASVDRARDAAGMRSRENSLASGVGAGVTMPVSRSRAPSASPSPGLQGQSNFQEPYFGGVGRQRRGSSASASANANTASRWEEAERARVLLEGARRENEMLANRVRELEGLLKESERGRRGASTVGGIGRGSGAGAGDGDTG